MSQVQWTLSEERLEDRIFIKGSVFLRFTIKGKIKKLNKNKCSISLLLSEIRSTLK